MSAFEEKLKELLGDEWFQVLREEVNKEYFIKLAKWIAYERQSHTIYPDSNDLFKAFKLTPPTTIKCVIVGQDPYYDGTANGLAFGYKDSIKPQGKDKSLDIIFKEMERDIKFGLYLDQDYSLEYLAKQGVFLLNTVLTVQRNKPASHSDKGIGWQKFTTEILEILLGSRNPKVFMLWGNHAQELFNGLLGFKQYKDGEHYYNFNTGLNKHFILKAKHPAADIHQKEGLEYKVDYPNTFLGCNHFSQANDFLKKNGIKEIIW